MYKKIVIAIATLMTPIIIGTSTTSAVNAQVNNTPIVYEAAKVTK